MRTITKIQQQKKSLHRYNIYLNDEYAFGIDEDILVKFQLHKGMTLTESTIEEIMGHEDKHLAYLMAIRYLSYRMRSTKEIETYLRKKEVSPQTIASIMARLQKENLLDDHAFAAAFVRDRMLQTSKGPRVIINELREKGVSQEVAEVAAEQYGLEQQVEKAQKWAIKEVAKKSSHSVRKRKEQLQYKLMQKGFSQEAVQIVMEEVTIEVDEETEKLRLEKQAQRALRRYERKHEGYELKMQIKAALYNRGFSKKLIDEYVDKMKESR